MLDANTGRIDSVGVVFAVVLSLALHLLLMSVQMVKLPPKPIPKQPDMQVVLVNAKTESKPVQADALAQSNLDGGGNTEKNLQAKTAMPTLPEKQQETQVEQAATRVKLLEEESRRVLSQVKSTYTTTEQEQENTPVPEPVKSQDKPLDLQELMAKSREIARQEAQIDKQVEDYQKIPRRKFVGARTQEYRFAQYVEDWRVKVERIGNLNYPAEARSRKLYGKLVLSVSIMADGTLEEVEVSRSSGSKVLDAAAVQIVKLAAPYTPLPPEITKDTDILTITRTWTFTQSNMLEGQ